MVKFLEAHRTDLLNAFKTFGFTKSDFHFIKRKGRVITHHRATKAEFSYFLKKNRRQPVSVEQLDEPEKFEIKFNSKKEEVDTWVDVLRNFDRWLRQFEVRD